MARRPEKTRHVLAFHEMKSVVTMQQQIRHMYGGVPLSKLSILGLYKRFVSDGCVCKGQSTGRPSVNEEHIENIKQSFLCSPQKLKIC